MFSTIIEFASNPEVVNAQTFDSVGIIPLVLLVLVTASGLFFAYKKKVFASVGHKGLHLKQFEWYASKKFIAAIFITVVAVACLCIFCISKSANAANALNVTTTDKVIGVVDEQTGKVTIDKAIVTNDEDHDLEFNSVSLALFPGINDGQCNWKISIAKDDEEDAEVVYEDVANNHNIFYTPWTFEAGQVYTLIFETQMDPVVAKSLEGQQIATLTYDITEHQERVESRIYFNETSITPAGQKVIEKNGWRAAVGGKSYVANKVRGSEIAPELVPFEQSMAAREI